MNPSFFPQWISFRALVANTILVEALLVLAVYWFVVRRAEQKRRALIIFLVVIGTSCLLEVLAGIELLGERGPRMKVHEVVSKRSGHMAIFQLDWKESPLLRRPSDQSVCVTWTRPMAAGSGGLVRQSLPPDVFADVWPRVVAGGTSLGGALWEALCASRLPATDPGIAAIVSRDRD